LRAIVAGEVPEPLEDLDEVLETQKISGEKLDHLDKEIAKIETHLESKYTLIDEVEQGVCPVCLTDIENPSELVNGVIEDHLSDLEDNLRDLRGQKKAAEKALSEINAEVQHTIYVWDEYELARIAAREAGGHMEDCDAIITDNERKIELLKKQLADLGPAPADVRDALKEAEEHLSSMRKQQTAAIAAKRIAKHKLDAIENHGEEIAEMLRGSELQRRKLGVLQELQKAMPKFRDDILSQALGWVAERASGLLLRATGNPWPLRIDTDLGFWVEDIPLEDFSSGQIDMVCVCLRIAVAEFLSKRIGMRGLMILDGVFDRIDEDNRDAIGRLVGEINVPQILLLSHFEVPVIEGERFTF
jgi:DNA repair exonuclease SbcCD ATPase subunit